MAIVVAAPLLLLALYYWASKDSGVDREIAKERFRAEQELHGCAAPARTQARPLVTTSKLSGFPIRQRQNMLRIDGLAGITEARKLSQQHPVIFGTVHFA